MEEQVPVGSSARADDGEEGGAHEVRPDLAYQRLAIVNVAYYGLRGAAAGAWVLIDTGVSGMVGAIRAAVEARFGADARPHAIVLTHGHFDHVGTLHELLRQWDVPVYAHDREIPYLDGAAAYLPPDPTVGGGVMASLSRFYPRGPVDIRESLRPLPADGSVPGMPGWRWIHTPDHTPGHVSLWRESDRTLIAGDAVITTRQESAYAVAVQRPELHGPPRYFTPDWGAAKRSAERLSALEPELLVTGHGPALRGSEMRMALQTLARDFDRRAVPESGRYVNEPARDGETRTVHVSGAGAHQEPRERRF